MNTDALTIPTVKAAIEAIQTGDKKFMDLSQRLLSGCARLGGETRLALPSGSAYR